MNKELHERVMQYLVAGGLHNPEHADHEKVRDLVIDLKKEVEQLEAERIRARAALWYYADRANYQKYFPVTADRAERFFKQFSGVPHE